MAGRERVNEKTGLHLKQYVNIPTAPAAAAVLSSLLKLGLSDYASHRQSGVGYTGERRNRISCENISLPFFYSNQALISETIYVLYMIY